jgi:Fe-S cluster assembly protein SufD
MTTAPAKRESGPRSKAEASFEAAWADSGAGKDGATALRQTGHDAFQSAGLPAGRLEDWKYTSLRAISRRAFRRAGPVSAPTPEELDAAAVAGLDGPRAVFLNGRLEPGLSDLDAGEGLQIQPLSEAIAEKGHPALTIAGALADATAHPLAALNQAFLGDGVYLGLSRNAAPGRPLYLMFLSSESGDPVVAHPRVIVDAQPGSELVLVEHYAGFGAARNLTNAVTEMRLGASSSIHHYRLQEEADTAFHIGGLHARVDRDARLTSHNLHVGAALARLDLGVNLEKPGAEVVLNGLYFVGGKRHVDNHTRVHHLAPETRSEEVYRGVVDGKAHAVFNGKVVVHPDAQRVDAHQSNKNLLLSRDAEVDTKPELEIYADDVKCSHGATVGQLDRDAMFYLLSRGIPEKVARDMLTFAFAEAVASRMPLAAIRQRIEARIAGALPDVTMIGAAEGGGS